MIPWGVAACGAGLALGAGVGLAAREVRKRNLGRWLAPFVARTLRRRFRRADPGGEVHLILAIADHFEPFDGGVSARQAMRRVEEWVASYPRVLGTFRDAD